MSDGHWMQGRFLYGIAVSGKNRPRHLDQQTGQLALFSSHLRRHSPWNTWEHTSILLTSNPLAPVSTSSPSKQITQSSSSPSVLFFDTGADTRFSSSSAVTPSGVTTFTGTCTWITTSLLTHLLSGGSGRDDRSRCSFHAMGLISWPGMVPERADAIDACHAAPLCCPPGSCRVTHRWVTAPCGMSWVSRERPARRQKLCTPCTVNDTLNSTLVIVGGTEAVVERRSPHAQWRFTFLAAAMAAWVGVSTVLSSSSEEPTSMSAGRSTLNSTYVARFETEAMILQDQALGKCIVILDLNYLVGWKTVTHLDQID